jgi:hypothetical protein
MLYTYLGSLNKHHRVYNGFDPVDVCSYCIEVLKGESHKDESYLLKLNIDISYGNGPRLPQSDAFSSPQSVFECIWTKRSVSACPDLCCVLSVAFV